MGRADAWVDSDQQEKDTQLEIMRDKAGSVDVYRKKGANAGAGFVSEVAEPVLLRTIEARIDNSRQEPDRALDNESDRQYTLVALTDDDDVRSADIWHWTDLAGQPQVYRVVRTEPIQAGCTVYLDALRKEAWPRIAA